MNQITKFIFVALAILLVIFVLVSVIDVSILRIGSEMPSSSISESKRKGVFCQCYTTLGDLDQSNFVEIWSERRYKTLNIFGDIEIIDDLYGVHIFADSNLQALVAIDDSKYENVRFFNNYYFASSRLDDCPKVVTLIILRPQGKRDTLAFIPRKIGD
ncbi:MAG: hypothetical protein SFY70_03160 [Bacteroidia bacterium]|nr:hypothetical protein [Bacteroidia bacterium]